MKRMERVILAHSGWWIVLFTLVSVALILWLPENQGKNFTDHNEARRTLIQICAALFAVLGFYLHFVRIRHASRGEANSRFVSLIELLGTMRDGDGGSKVPNAETRLCAIYGLWRLGEDSESDYQNIVRSLARYIQINAKDITLIPPDGSTLAVMKKNRQLRADLQTGIEVLAHCSPHRRTPRPVIDLREAYLRDLELDGLNLDGADFRAAALQSAVLKGVSLQGAKLDGAALDDASLETAVFSPATSFDRADIKGAHFYRDADRPKCSEDSRRPKSQTH